MTEFVHPRVVLGPHLGQPFSGTTLGIQQLSCVEGYEYAPFLFGLKACVMGICGVMRQFL